MGDRLRGCLEQARDQWEQIREELLQCVLDYLPHIYDGGIAAGHFVRAMSASEETVPIGFVTKDVTAFQNIPLADGGGGGGKSLAEAPYSPSLGSVPSAIGLTTTWYRPRNPIWSVSYLNSSQRFARRSVSSISPKAGGPAWSCSSSQLCRWPGPRMRVYSPNG